MTENREHNAPGPKRAVRVRVELGRRMIDMRDLAEMDRGRVVELDCQPGEVVDVYADGVLHARGEPMIVDGRFAVRMTDVSVAAGGAEALAAQSTSGA